MQVARWAAAEQKRRQLAYQDHEMEAAASLAAGSSARRDVPYAATLWDDALVAEVSRLSGAQLAGLSEMKGSLEEAPFNAFTTRVLITLLLAIRALQALYT